MDTGACADCGSQPVVARVSRSRHGCRPQVSVDTGRPAVIRSGTVGRHVPQLHADANYPRRFTTYEYPLTLLNCWRAARVFNRATHRFIRILTVVVRQGRTPTDLTA